jgi:hypothetical protein
LHKVLKFDKNPRSGGLPRAGKGKKNRVNKMEVLFISGVLYTVAFVFRARLMLPGRFDLVVAKSPDKAQFQLTGIVVAVAMEVLAGVVAGDDPRHGIKDIANRGSGHCLTFKQRLLKPGVQAPERLGPERALPDIP